MVCDRLLHHIDMKNSISFARMSVAGFFVFLFVMSVSAVGVRAQTQRAITDGAVVVSGFSGVTTPRGSARARADETFIDLKGASLRMFGTSSLSPGQTPIEKLSVPSSNIGQVFGIAVDDHRSVSGKLAPNFYLTATSIYGLNIVTPDTDRDGRPERVTRGNPQASWMAGQWGDLLRGGPGSVYKINGETGQVTLFANITLDGIPNSGPALGNITYDAQSKSLYVSDRETGMIFQLDVNGKVIDEFDHGVFGRRAISLDIAPYNPAARINIRSPAFRTDNPGTWGLPVPERRIWGVAAWRGRLYYAVAEGPQIWSADIHSDGTIGKARLEFNLPSNTRDSEVSDIAFTSSGDMLLALRGVPTGAFDVSQKAVVKGGQVLRYAFVSSNQASTRGRWRQRPTAYHIGQSAGRSSGEGGIALAPIYRNGRLISGTCTATLWATGTALTRGTDKMDGVQTVPTASARANARRVTGAYILDFDGENPDTGRVGYLGDVELARDCEGGPSGYTSQQVANVPPAVAPRPDGTTPQVRPRPRPPIHKLIVSKTGPRACGFGEPCAFHVTIRNAGTQPLRIDARADDNVRLIGSVNHPGRPVINTNLTASPGMCAAAQNKLPFNCAVQTTLAPGQSITDIFVTSFSDPTVDPTVPGNGAANGIVTLQNCFTLVDAATGRNAGPVCANVTLERPGVVPPGGGLVQQPPAGGGQWAGPDIPPLFPWFPGPIGQLPPGQPQPQPGPPGQPDSALASLVVEKKKTNNEPCRAGEECSFQVAIRHTGTVPFDGEVGIVDLPIIGAAGIGNAEITGFPASSCVSRPSVPATSIACRLQLKLTPGQTFNFETRLRPIAAAVGNATQGRNCITIGRPELADSANAQNGGQLAQGDAVSQVCASFELEPPATTPAPPAENAVAGKLICPAAFDAEGLARCFIEVRYPAGTQWTKHLSLRAILPENLDLISTFGSGNTEPDSGQCKAAAQDIICTFTPDSLNGFTAAIASFKVRLKQNFSNLAGRTVIFVANAYQVAQPGNSPAFGEIIPLNPSELPIRIPAIARVEQDGYQVMKSCRPCPVDAEKCLCDISVSFPESIPDLDRVTISDSALVGGDALNLEHERTQSYPAGALIDLNIASRGFGGVEIFAERIGNLREFETRINVLDPPANLRQITNCIGFTGQRKNGANFGPARQQCVTIPRVDNEERVAELPVEEPQNACEQGFRWNTARGRCEPDGSWDPEKDEFPIAQQQQPLEQEANQCPAGFAFDAKRQRCRPIGSAPVGPGGVILPTCRGGAVYVSARARCECPASKQWDARRQRCINAPRTDEPAGGAGPARPNCPVGQSYDNDRRKCVNNCRAGQVWDNRRKRCVTPPPALICLKGGQVRGNICWCGPGRFPFAVRGRANTYECRDVKRPKPKPAPRPDTGDATGCPSGMLAYRDDCVRSCPRGTRRSGNKCVGGGSSATPGPPQSQPRPAPSNQLVCRGGQVKSGLCWCGLGRFPKKVPGTANTYQCR